MDESTRDDVAHDVMMAAVADGFAALRRAAGETPLDAWAIVTAKHLVFQRLRKERSGDRRTLEQAESAVDSRQDDDANAPDEDRSQSRVAELLRLLTPEQMRVQAAILVHRTERRAAAALGTTRDHVRDVKRRAERRMRSGTAWVPSDRRWIAEAKTLAELRGDLGAVELLRMVAIGNNQREIAASLRVSRSAVRGRLYRLRRNAMESLRNA